MNLNKRIVLERRGTSQGTTGQVIENWAPFYTGWASINPVAGREYFNASGERAEITHQLEMRYGVTVKPKDRACYNGRVFDIRSVLNEREQNRKLILMAVEHVQ